MYQPKDFVLIPGAWMGAWAWDEVAERLRDLGHRPHPLTLSGIDSDGDASDIGLETHVADVLEVIESRDLRDAVVVGHSYSGLIAGLVADRVPDRAARVVYVAAFLPREGEAMVDAFSESQREDERREIEENGGRWPPPDAEGLSYEKDLTESQCKQLVDRFVKHPGRTVTEPVTLRRPLAEQEATYVVCTLEQGEAPAAVSDLRDAPTWTIRKIAAGHFPMISVPDELTALLVTAEGAGGRAE